jgi:hypothetical protein
VLSVTNLGYCIVCLEEVLVFIVPIAGNCVDNHMKPTNTVIAALTEMGLSEVIPELRYSNLFEVWFFSYREMQFGVDRDGIITLFDLTKY